MQKGSNEREKEERAENDDIEPEIERDRQTDKTGNQAPQKKEKEIKKEKQKKGRLTDIPNEDVCPVRTFPFP